MYYKRPNQYIMERVDVRLATSHDCKVAARNLQVTIMIVDTFENWRFYFSDCQAWQCAFDYLRTLTPDAEPGEMTSVMGETVMARVMCYETRPVENAVLEAHDRYVDIQISLVNTECIDWYPRASLMTKTPYDVNADVVFFDRPDAAPLRVVNRPGMFTVLFPQDAHSPQLMPGTTPGLVKKVVVKVLASALQTGQQPA